MAVGSNTMKTLMIVVCLLLTLISYEGIAKKNDNIPFLIETKCFVELYDGYSTIVYQMVGEKQLKKLTKTLVDSFALTTFSAEELQISKVFECTLLNDKFTNIQAITVEKGIAR